jgi:hypothetical protein
LPQQAGLLPWWWLVVPGLARLFGRLPSRRLGLGEDQLIYDRSCEQVQADLDSVNPALRKSRPR